MDSIVFNILQIQYDRLFCSLWLYDNLVLEFFSPLMIDYYRIDKKNSAMII